MNQLNHNGLIMSNVVESFFLYSTTIAENLLLVDEIMKAGMSSLKG